MPKLKNNRHETFASLIAAGRSCAEAYRSAGYKVKHPDLASDHRSTQEAAIKGGSAVEDKTR